MSTATITAQPALPSYFVVMIDHGRLGREAIVDPEVTRREVISRIADGNYPRDSILFIQSINGRSVEDITAEIMDEVEPLIAEAA